MFYKFYNYKHRDSGPSFSFQALLNPNQRSFDFIFRFLTHKDMAYFISPGIIQLTCESQVPRCQFSFLYCMIPAQPFQISERKIKRSNVSIAEIHIKVNDVRFLQRFQNLCSLWRSIQNVEWWELLSPNCQFMHYCPPDSEPFIS